MQCIHLFPKIKNTVEQLITSQNLYTPQNTCQPPAITESSRNLNMTSEYMKSLPVTIREHVQNWKDQCVKVAQRHRMAASADDLRIVEYQDNASIIYLYLGGNMCMGFMCMTENRSTHSIHVSLCNLDTFLDPEMLFLGESSKKDDNTTGGAWGEGGKTEANRLCAVRNDSAVLYHTGAHIWRFHHHDGKHFTVNFETAPQFLPHTVIHLDAPRSAFSKSDFLFLHPNVQRLHTPQHALQIICNPEQVGCIFTHGILVCRDKKAFPSFGINWIGGITNEMGLGRDRFNIDRKFMAAQLIPSINEMDKHDILHTEQGKALCAKLVQEFIQRRGELQSVIQYAIFGDHMRATAWNFEHFGTIMLRALVEHKGTQAVLPFNRDTDPDLEEEAEMFGYQGVALSAHFVRLLQQSPHCAKIEHLRQQYFSDYMRLPEGRPDSMVPTDDIEREKHNYEQHSRQFNVAPIHWWPSSSMEGYLSQHLLNFVAAILYPQFVPSLHQIKFKDFSQVKSNKQPIVFLEDPKDGREYYLVDWHSFDPDMVHAELLRDDNFQCSGKNCGCVFQKFWDHVMRILELRKNVPTKTLQSLNRRMIGVLFGSLNAMNFKPSHEIAPAPRRVDSGEEAETVEMSEVQKRSPRGSSRGGSLVPHSRNAIAEGIMHQIREVIHVTMHKDAPTSVSPHQHHHHDGLSVCKQPDQTSLERNGTTQRGIPVHVDIHDPEARGFITTHAQTVELAALIVEVIARLFDLQNSNERTVFHLFYKKDSPTVAFNIVSVRELYFNIAVFHEWFSGEGEQQSKSDLWQHLMSRPSLQQCLGFWFMTFCHELAHNVHFEHNRAHQELEESLCTYGMPRLYEKVYDKIRGKVRDGVVHEWGRALLRVLDEWQ